MRGNTMGAPPHAASSASASPSPSPVAPLTLLEYQPVRVLTSVLFNPQAPTRIKASP